MSRAVFNYHRVTGISHCAVLLALMFGSLLRAGQIDQQAAAAQIKTMAGAQVKIAWVRSNNGAIDYLGCGFKDQMRSYWTIMVFDTEEGRERPFAPGTTVDTYSYPLITPNGRRLIWTRGRKDIFIANWDGSNPRLLLNGIKAMAVAEDPPGTEWVYVAEEEQPDPGGSPKSIYRYQIDKLAIKQLVWNKAAVGCKLELTRDGKWAVAEFGGNACSLAEFPNGSLKTFGHGCNAGISMDGTQRVWHMLGGHTGIQMYDKGITNGRYLKFDDGPGRNGANVEWWYPSALHSSEGRCFTLCGPWKGPRNDHGNIIVGKFNEDYKGVEKWVRVTDLPQSEIYVYGWLAPPNQPPRILQQPQNVSAQDGEQVEFTVQAEGGPTPALQWQQNGKDIPGATGTTYSVTANRAVKDAVFICVAKNTSGSVKSQPAKLSVKLKGPTPEVLASWDAKLQARLREALKSGRQLALNPKDRANPRAISAIDSNGNLSVELAPGVSGGLPWPQLSGEEKAALALAVSRENEPSDQSIAAFYLLATGRDADAEAHLGKSGKEGETVRSIFK